MSCLLLRCSINENICPPSQPTPMWQKYKHFISTHTKKNKQTNLQSLPSRTLAGSSQCLTKPSLKFEKTNLLFLHPIATPFYSNKCRDSSSTKGISCTEYQHQLMTQNLHIQGAQQQILWLFASSSTYKWSYPTRPSLSSLRSEEEEQNTQSNSNLHVCLNTGGYSLIPCIPETQCTRDQEIYIHLTNKQQDKSFWKVNNELKDYVNCNHYSITSCFHLLGFRTTREKQELIQ